MHRTVGSRSRNFLASLIATVALFAIPTAHASSTMEIIGATTGGNQITARVLSHGSAATYFNPSLLPEAAPNMEVSFYALSMQGNIRLKARPDGVDVPTSVYSTAAPGRPLATADLPNRRADTTADSNVVYAAIGMEIGRAHV